MVSAFVDRPQSQCRSGRLCGPEGTNHGSRLTWNPKAFSRSGGTYLWSLLRSTHSRSSVELWYCSGESLRESTTLSNELAEKEGATVARGIEFEFARWVAIESLRD